MPQQVRWRRQKNLSYSENNTVTEELGRGMIYRELYLRLRCTLEAAAGNAVTQANTERGDHWGIVRDIKIVANGSQVLRRFSGNELRWINKLIYGYNPRNPLAPGIAAEGTLAIDDTLIIPFWSPTSIRPIDTALDARLLSSLEIEVTWGDAADVSSATSFSFSVDPTLQVCSLESFGISADFATDRIFKIQSNGVAANDNFEVDIPVNDVYRAFLINASASDVDQSYLDNIKLKSGTTVFADLPAQVLKDSTLLRQGIQIGYDDAGTANDQVFVSADSDIEGWYLLNLITDGRLSEGVDARGLAELKLELNVNTQADIVVLPYSFTPVTPSNGG